MDQWDIICPTRGQPINLPFDTHLVQIETAITVFIKFRGTCKITRNQEIVTINFPNITWVSLGFRSLVRRPRETLTFPKSYEGIANAITYSSNRIRTSSPDRSYQSMRPHPPEFEFGPMKIPKRYDKSLNSKVEIILPGGLEYLYSSAPLAYYCRSEVKTDSSIDKPILSISEFDFHKELPKSPEFEDMISDLLLQHFTLDCLVRNSGRYGTEKLDELKLLKIIDIDIDEMYDTSIEKRVYEYLNIPFEKIRDQLPNWHLAISIEPTFNNVKTIPYLLDRLSFIKSPNHKSVDKYELVDLFNKQSFRKSRKSSKTKRTDFQLIRPDIENVRSHGWAADGVPITGFKLIPRSFENRIDYLENRGFRRIMVVLNDEMMEEEEKYAVGIYDNKSEDISIQLEIKYSQSRSQFKRILESNLDFLHYIGHCDPTRFRCSDGNLSVRDIDESRVRTFFLNACESYQEGVNLIHKGSVAGVVTYSDVLDQPATEFGTAFSSLFINGFDVESSLRLARMKTLSGVNYLVVGDGTYEISQGEDLQPVVFFIESLPDSRYCVRPQLIESSKGSIYQLQIQNEDKWYLSGNQPKLVYNRRELCEKLEAGEGPIIFDNRYYERGEFLDEISN